MLTDKGIILVATGHPYYGRCAFNLAVSIKANEPEMPICLITHGRAMSHIRFDQKFVFDEIIELPLDHDIGLSLKTQLYELSPFEKTLYLDVDMVWMPMKKPSELFADLKGHEFTAITEGYYDATSKDEAQINGLYYFWADVHEIESVYMQNGGKIYQWRSEVMYFEKSEKTSEFFKTVQYVYKNSLLKTVRDFGGSIPDELAINIGTYIHGIDPHKYKWTPAYWPRLNQEFIPDYKTLYSKYYLFSAGSNYASGAMKTVYNKIMKAACHKMGLQYLFTLQSKKGVIPERSEI